VTSPGPKTGVVGRWLFLAFLVALVLLLAFVIIPGDRRIYNRCVADLTAKGVPRQSAESACV
jgi:hypothetical protein